jgi:hypothetical protein
MYVGFENMINSALWLLLKPSYCMNQIFQINNENTYAPINWHVGNCALVSIAFL